MRKFFQNTSPLSRRLILSIVFCSSLITIFATGVQLLYDYRKDLDSVTQTFDRIDESYHGILATALWNVDVDAVQQIYRSVSPFPKIDFVKISFAEGTSVGQSPPPSGQILVRTIDLYYRQGAVPRLVGTLTLASNLNLIYQELSKKLLIILLAQSTKTALVVLFMLFIVDKLIMQHLRRIAAFAKQMPFKDQGIPPMLSLGASSKIEGELNDVVRAMNEMRQNIDRSFRDLESSEHQLRTLNASLEQEVKRRVLENEKQQMLIQHSAKLSSLGEMAGNIAHEINNPLAIIAGYMQIIKKHLTGQSVSPLKLEEYGKKVEATIQRISGIIAGLLRLSRDDPKAELSIHAIKQIVQDATNLCREKFVSHGIRLIFVTEFDELQVACRPTELGQILLNLLNNAFDAVRGQASPWIQVELFQSSDLVVFAVSNSGPGIDPAIRLRILEPFFTTKPYGHGTGLGLSLSRMIAEGHKGRLFLDESSAHTRFVVELPIVQHLNHSVEGVDNSLNPSPPNDQS